MTDPPATLIRLAETSGALMALYDPDDRLRYANAAFRAAFFLEEGEQPWWPDLMRRNYHAGRGTLIRAEDFEAWLISTQSRRGKAGFRTFETDLRDGRWLLMSETVSEDGWMLCIANDVTDLKADGRSVRQDRDLALKAAQTDELTGVSNRRYVMARAESMLKEMPGRIGSLALFDIDGFKAINDRHGHHAGDLVLCDFARLIHGRVRRTDCFGRVGGEEFLLVLPGAGPDQALAIVERMLAATRASRPLPEAEGFAYTFSAGIARAWPGDSLRALYARADRALYAAKAGGRNRIEVAEG